GRHPASIECVLSVPVVSGTDAIDQARAYLAGYARVPEYARSLRHQQAITGGDAMPPVTIRSDEGAEDLIDAAMVRSLVLPGDPEAGQSLLAAFQSAGVDTLLLLPIRPRASAADGYESAKRILHTWAATWVGA